MTKEQKMCFTCRDMKPLSDFNPRHAGGTKLHSSCKVCMAAEAKRRRDEEKRRLAQGQRAYPPVDVTENNAFNLWHGPVSREQPLRWQA